MRITTSYFANLKEVHSQGLVPIAICAYPPKFFTGLNYYKLSPRPEMLKMAPWQYKPLFAEMLNILNPDQVLKDLHTLAEGKDIALICFEKPSDFCHRHLVAKWLQDKTGLTIEELPNKAVKAISQNKEVQTMLF